MERKKYLILAPTPAELWPLAGRLGLKNTAREPREYQGEFSGQSVVLLESGFGKKFKNNIEKILTDWPAEKVILAGTAAALDKELRVGDVFLVNKFFSEDKNNLPGLIPEALRKMPATVSVTGGPLADIQTKQEFKFHHPASAIYDQEDFYLARAARDLGANILVIRAISDAAGDEMPAPMMIYHHFEKIKLKYLWWDFLRHRTELMRLFAFRKNFQLAIRRAAEVAAEVIVKWGPSPESPVGPSITKK